ncbi:MAG: class I SAM-dependent methyltransferase, partial [Pseudomonadota bacterium]
MEHIFTEAAGFTRKTGYKAPGLNRLNARYAAMIHPNRAHFAGARVLDLASHDGRWSFAALKAGAAHVTGIEVRAKLIARSANIIPEQDRARVRFIEGDVFEEMPRLLADGTGFDIVLCLGLFYHILDHDRLLRLMAAFKPGLIILDTGLVDSDEAFIHLKTEATDSVLNAAPRGDLAEAPVGVVSRAGMAMLAAAHGYGLEYIDWDALDWPDRRNLHD